MVIKLHYASIYGIHLQEATQGTIWLSKGHFDFYIMADNPQQPGT